MGANKSLDWPLQLITALLSDVQTLHSEVFTYKAMVQTRKKVESRCLQEGVGFLTKTLPRLGKALDKALAEAEPLDSVKLGFDPQPNSKLPKLFGELFQQVLSHDGVVLPDADVKSVISLRQLAYCFYKYGLPYDTTIEQSVLAKFKKTEQDITTVSQVFSLFSKTLDDNSDSRAYLGVEPEWIRPIICRARRLLFELFKSFDRRDIFPRHGPGAVAEKLQPWDKYRWTNIPDRLSNEFPIDEYFMSSQGHLLDTYRTLSAIGGEEPYARVCLVPKDSRGPRIISCEPHCFQWIQQGLRDAIYRLVEGHRLTRDEVRFTNQQPNQFGALIGSKYGRYATLDLNEASDRVSVGLVQLLFPGQVLPALMASRSLGTQLPDGEKVLLEKFAPMGSALCFPVLALTIWALLRAGLEERFADSEVTVYVYGDDVIVDTAQAEHAMNILEAFGLRVNRDKSCTSGFFRESCGMDAYRGVCVTPVRFKTVWSNHHCPSAYTAWIAYATALHYRRYYTCYNLIVDRLIDLYEAIPEKACTSIVGKGLNPFYDDSAPSLPLVPRVRRHIKHRWSESLQKTQRLVWCVVPMSVSHEIDGWSMLLRYFAEACSAYESARQNKGDSEVTALGIIDSDFCSSEYTLRRQSKLRRCWR